MTGPERPAFVAGELVDVAIRSAVVGDPQVSGWLKVRVAHTGVGIVLPLNNSDVTITRQAPVEWPPLEGDLWRDRDGGLWFAYNYVTPSRTELRLTPNREHSHTGTWWPERLLTERGPVQLVHRELVDDSAEVA